MTLRRVIDKYKVNTSRPEDFHYKSMYKEVIGKVDFKNTIEAISNIYHAKGYYKRSNRKYKEEKDVVKSFRPQR